MAKGKRFFSTVMFFLLTLMSGNGQIFGQESRMKLSHLILGGELSNSAATSVDDIDKVLSRMSALGLNTVLVPAYWELIEPHEGTYDFTLIERTIHQAKAQHLKIVFLWFGAWKNSMSCYAPVWFKQDTKRFPRAMTREGKPLEIACAFSENVFQADNRAFTAFVECIAKVDAQRETVVMIQVENEIGMLESARDHSPLAEKAFNSVIPEKVRKVLGIRKKQTWREVNEDDLYWDEQFMAYYYACYVERLAQSARNIMPDMPLYVNAAMNSRGRKPGEYPSAGPLAHLMDIWHVGAPSIDILAPDIYDTGFKSWASQYARPDNLLFIPESRCQNSGVRCLYTFGEHHALGFSPFAIDQASPAETESVTQAYGIMNQLAHLPLSKLTSWGLLFDQEDKERVIEDRDDVVMTCRHYFTLPWDPRATDGTPWLEGGAILMRMGKYDYLLAGSGIVVDFKTKSEKTREVEKVLGEDGFVLANGAVSSVTSTAPTVRQKTKWKRLGLASVDEVRITDDGTLQYLRRHNGDQTHQGRHARISVGEWKILHIRLYEYE